MSLFGNIPRRSDEYRYHPHRRIQNTAFSCWGRRFRLPKRCRSRKTLNPFFQSQKFQKNFPSIPSITYSQFSTLSRPPRPTLSPGRAFHPPRIEKNHEPNLKSHHPARAPTTPLNPVPISHVKNSRAARRKEGVFDAIRPLYLYVATWTHPTSPRPRVKNSRKPARNSALFWRAAMRCFRPQAPQPAVLSSSATMDCCQAPGFVQWAVANPARSGRKQR